jgi:putative transposase
MARHTTFRFCLDPTVEQREVLARHGGASRFAFNQCLRIVKSALTQRRTVPDTAVPWTGFDLINAFNAWKKTEDAGRVFTVDATGEAEVVVTGLSWRREVCQQVFEEAAVDLGRGLAAWSDSRSGTRTGTRVGFPRFKTKTGNIASFRLRNKHPKGKPAAIRIGEHRPRSVTLPGIGAVGVHDDTRRLRRMLGKDRAKILFATLSHHGGRWWIALRSRPPICTLPSSTAPVALTILAAGWGWTAACRRSWSPPPSRAPRSPASTMRPRRWPPA